MRRCWDRSPATDINRARRVLPTDSFTSRFVYNQAWYVREIYCVNSVTEGERQPIILLNSQLSSPIFDSGPGGYKNAHRKLLRYRRVCGRNLAFQRSIWYPYGQVHDCRPGLNVCSGDDDRLRNNWYHGGQPWERGRDYGCDYVFPAGRLPANCSPGRYLRFGCLRQCRQVCRDSEKTRGAGGKGE